MADTLPRELVMFLELVVWPSSTLKISNFVTGPEYEISISLDASAAAISNE